VIRCWPVMMEAWFQSLVSPCKICDGQNAKETGFSLITLVLLRQDPSINAPYSFVHLSSALHNLSVVT
jgi:hypothetical protein